jgi:hypothetical protein
MYIFIILVLFLSIFYNPNVYMSGFIKDNCAVCFSCHESCASCPNGLCQVNAMNIHNMSRVNKQVRMDSSQSMMMKKVGTVSKIVGQNAKSGYLGQAGGPGDSIPAVQRSCSSANARAVRYRLPHKQARTANKNHSGVDKKHGSYARFLARRVGGVLREEKMPTVIARRSIIKQPRNRTGTNSGVTKQSRISTKVNYCLNGNSRGPQGKRVMMLGGNALAYTGYKDRVTTYNKTKEPVNNTSAKGCPSTIESGGNNCFNETCCVNRIPATATFHIHVNSDWDQTPIGSALLFKTVSGANGTAHFNATISPSYYLKPGKDITIMNFTIDESGSKFFLTQHFGGGTTFSIDPDPVWRTFNTVTIVEVGTKQTVTISPLFEAVLKTNDGQQIPMRIVAGVNGSPQSSFSGTLKRFKAGNHYIVTFSGPRALTYFLDD